MYNINDYMTPEEAAHRWRIPPETVKNKTKPSTANQEEIEQMIKNGLIKYFQKPGGKRKEERVDYIDGCYGILVLKE